MITPARVITISVLLMTLAYTAHAAASTACAGVREGRLEIKGARLVTDVAKISIEPDGPVAGSGAIAGVSDGPIVIELDRKLSMRGAITFWMRQVKSYSSGIGRPKETFDVLVMPGVGRCWFQQQSADCLLAWDWDKDVVEGGGWIGAYIPELPGGEWYQLVYTWDAAKGLLDGYFNGTPQREPGVKTEPWSLPGALELKLYPGAFEIADVRIEYEFLSEQKVRDRLPAHYAGRRAEIFGAGKLAPPMDVSDRLGKLLYECGMGDAADIEGWKLEGPGIISFEDAWMRMSSKLVDGKPKGHIVHWCPQEFPGSFVAEWDFQVIVPDSGLCIVFFAAKGENGESIFDPGLPPRDGTFKQYTSDKLVSYHISYYAAGRGISNLRKNNHFCLIANGPSGIGLNDTSPHKFRLIKDGAHIQMQMDGRVIIDCTDDGTRCGPVLGGGWIGLRQMEATTARYRNFRVYELKD